MQGLIASLVAFGINFRASIVQCPDAVYIVFICLSTSSLFLALFFIRPPSQIVRSDGKMAVELKSSESPLLKRLVAQFSILQDWRVVILLIPFFASEMVLTVSSTISGMPLTYYSSAVLDAYAEQLLISTSGRER